MNLLQIIWDPSPTIFDAGGFSIRWYGFLFALGFFFAYVILYFLFKKEKVPFKMLDRLTLYVFLATLVGARLGHCFFYDWSYYREHPLEILMVWEGGLASHGAAIAIVIALIIYIRQYKVNLWWLFDRVSVAIPVSAAFVRFGNLMNSEIYGYPTSLPWGFIFRNGNEVMPDGSMLDNIPCHPTQLYEAFSYLFISLLLIILYRKLKGVIRPGLFVGLFLTIMFTARFLIEFLKVPQENFANSSGLDMGQWLSIPFILLGIYFIIHAIRTVNIPKAPVLPEKKNQTPKKPA